MAFGGETIDHLGVIRDFPALSMVTGLFANALGWRREDATQHDHLQRRLIMGAWCAHGSRRITDFQTAHLGANDNGWTTRGVPEERSGGPATYDSPHLRYRDFHVGLSMLVAIRLEPTDVKPTIDDLAHALDHPARPLFIGRKSCLPSRRMFAGWLDADNILEALQRSCAAAERQSVRMQWPDGEGCLPGDRVLDICDERNWSSGVHGGWRPIREGTYCQEAQS